MSDHPENLLLMSLSAESRGSILALSTHIPLPLRTELYRPEQMPAYVYFLTTGIASVVTSMPTGGTAEVGVIGHEGIAGGLQLLVPAAIQLTVLCNWLEAPTEFPLQSYPGFSSPPRKYEKPF